jgi:hypothetical protein
MMGWMLRMLAEQLLRAHRTSKHVLVGVCALVSTLVVS